MKPADGYAEFINDIKSGTVSTWNGILYMNYISEEDDLQLAREAVEYGIAVEGQTHGEFVDGDHGDMGGMDMDIDLDDLIDFIFGDDSAATIGASMTAVAAIAATLM